MTHRIEIRSRSGNVALGVVGAIYFIWAVGIFLPYVVTSWGGATVLDHLLQLTLAGSALAGAFLLTTATGTWASACDPAGDTPNAVAPRIGYR